MKVQFFNIKWDAPKPTWPTEVSLVMESGLHPAVDGFDALANEYGEAISFECEVEPTACLRLTLDVEYVLNGESLDEMAENLTAMCRRAIGEGMLTGSSMAECESHSIDVAKVEPDLDEEDISAFMLNRIESGDLVLEDIPVRLARYGLMERSDFIAEMRERMAMDEEENSFIPISFSGDAKSISDDDLCSECEHCVYRPGELSGCRRSWPGLEDENGYVQKCDQFSLDRLASKREGGE